MSEIQPLLSVCFITYNHEKYIRQALESILMQKVDFPIEIVIGNDCSTDGTSAIVKEYLEQFPTLIRLNEIQSNIGMTANWLSTISACKGKYIAMLEGDDYWTDVNKLQKQVEFLESHSNYSFVAHDLSVIEEKGVLAKDSLLHFSLSQEFTIFDIFKKQIFLQTATLVFRREMLQSFPSWADKRVKSIDILLYMMLATQAPFYYIAEKMSVYRLHEGGISHVNWVVKQNQFELDMVFIFENFNTFSNYQFKEEIADKIESYYLNILHNTPIENKLYRNVLFRLTKLKPKKHSDLVKGYFINRYIPKIIYKLYSKAFRK
jgi:glycosyltransferase involved in cell wall biosynthesis